MEEYQHTDQIKEPCAVTGIFSMLPRCRHPSDLLGSLTVFFCFCFLAFYCVGPWADSREEAAPDQCHVGTEAKVSIWKRSRNWIRGPVASVDPPRMIAKGCWES